jgi:uncharacterized membrane protein YeaQ/YmgE (transglycosylase-associated protein family)
MPESALSTFIILVVIGIVVGLIFNRYARTWLGRQVADATGVGDITYSLIGIAGSFMGYHVGIILGLLPSAMLYLIAIIGAALTLWLWRGR